MDQLFSNLNYTKLLPLLVPFILGSLFTILYSAYKARNTNKNLRIFFISWYKMSVAAVERQIDHLNTYTEALKKDKDYSAIFKSNNIQLDRLLSIPHKEIFTAFVFSFYGKTETNSKRIFSLIANISYIIKVIDQLHLRYKENREEVITWQSEWNKTIFRFNDTKHTYLIKHLNNGANVFVEKIHELHLQLIQDKEYIPAHIYIESYVNPLEAIVKQHVYEDSQNEIAISFLKELQALQALRMKQDAHINSSIELFQTYKSSLLDTIVQNENNISYFDKYLLFQLKAAWRRIKMNQPFKNIISPTKSTKS